MKRQLILLFVIALLVAGCGTPSQTVVSVPQRPTTDPFIAVEQAERTAEAARNEADFYSRQLTATAEAPIVAITATAAAFQMEQEFARATQISQMATETAAMTSTAMSWTPTANATATKIAIQIQAEGTMTANQVELNNLKVERERTMNTVKAMSAYVVGLAFLFIALMFGIGQAKKSSIFVVPSDERGNPHPIFLDGVVVDVDRLPNGMAAMDKGYLKQLPAITAERQDMVTGHDQMIDLKTRSAAVRRLTKNLEQAMLPAFTQEPATVAEPDDYDLHMALPHWDLMRDWNGQADPLGFGKRGLITSKSSSLHLMISGKSGSGKTRFMLRTITTADLSKGTIVIDLGGPASVGFGVFRNHPNFYTAPVHTPRDIVPCLQSIYEEMKERKAVIGGMDTDWEHWGSQPPRPFVTLLMDELGNMAEDLFYDKDDKRHELWGEMWSLITRIGNEGRKVGIRFAAALQNPTSDSVDLRFRRNCTLVSFQLGDKSQSSAFLGSTGAEQLTEGHFMARVESVLFGGGFCPSDDEIMAYLRGRQVREAEPSKWIDAVVTKQVEGPREAPAQVDEIGQLAESIRGEWNPTMSKRAVGRLLGKSYAGAWAEKIDQVVERLTATTTPNVPVLGAKMA